MVNRRQFLKRGAAATVLASAPAIVRGQNLNSRLQIAAIGSDGRGHRDIKEMVTHPKQQFVAFCDVDLNRTKNALKLVPNTPVYQDFREMFEKASDGIDAVLVATPDHMHAYCTISAMKLGKHVYCQKPLTHNVWETREVAGLAKKSGVITRMGNQIHSHEFYLTAVKLIQSGAIGKVKQVHSWVSIPGHLRSGYSYLPDNVDPIPESLDWDKWIGVAPMRDYVGGRCYAPWGWRDWQDFGLGAIGDFGCHIFDPVFTALDISGYGDNFRAEHNGMNDQVWPAQTKFTFTVPGTKHTAAENLRITWYNGGLYPAIDRKHMPEREALPPSGSMLVGDSGVMILPHIGKPILYLQGKVVTDYEMAEAKNHFHDWIDGCLEGKQPSDGFDYAALLTEVTLLGTIALRYPKEVLKWDAENMRFSNNESANQWLTREYREGWDLKALIDSI